MPITKEFLSSLAGPDLRLIYAKRRDLPFEEKFAHNTLPVFTEEELESRKRAIYELSSDPTCKIDPAEDEKRATSFAAQPAAWVTILVRGGGWSEYAYALGKNIFGDVFDNYKRYPVKTVEAIIFPDSPFLSVENYWKCATGLTNVKFSKTANEEIAQLHEIGHAHFVFITHGMEDGLEKDYLREALADGFAVKTYLNSGGKESDVQEYIQVRRISAFLYNTTAACWTSAACEATLRGNPLPSFAEASRSMHELQLRVFDDLRGADGLTLNEAFYRKEHPDIASHLKENGYNKPISTETQIRYLSGYFSSRPSHEIMESLARVMKKSKMLSPETRAEGEAILKAYEHFCPKEPKHFLPSSISRLYAKFFKG